MCRTGALMCRTGAPLAQTRPYHTHSRPLWYTVAPLRHNRYHLAYRSARASILGTRLACGGAPAYQWCTLFA